MIVPVTVVSPAPYTSQSPAVKVILVIFFVTPVVRVEAVAVFDKNSPVTPADASSLVVVPTFPPVVGENVILVAVAAPRVGVVKVIFVAAMPDGSVVDRLGTPPLSVTITELFAVGISSIVSVEAEYKILFIVELAGHLVPDQAGAALVPH